MLVEALFWFHPLVWWLGARLIYERERSCDEAVLQSGCEPKVYAEGLLKICELYLASPLPCVSGVTGSNLKGRIEAIMSNRAAPGLNTAKKVLLTVTGSAALMAPIMGGFMNGPLVRAQSPQARSEFEVASIKPLRGGGGSINTIELNFGMSVARASTRGRFGTDLPLESLIQLAYGVKQVQILGAPSWAHSDLYRIDAKASSDATFEQMRPMLQSLLTDRFGLKLHREVKETTVYALVISKGGPKIERAKDGSCVTIDPNGPLPPLGSKICGGFTRGMMTNGPEQKDRLQGFGILMPKLVEFLSDEVGTTVVDKTGFTGMFDVQLEFVPGKALAGDLPTAPGGDRAASASSATFAGPSIFTALQEQLGLRLEPAKGPAEFLIVDHVERPSAN
jgi:bla regulator protein BlaR1